MTRPIARLRPCVACNRHVRVTETSCPFCASAVEAGPVLRAPDARLSRAAQLAFCVVLVGATSARCAPARAPHVTETPMPTPEQTPASSAEGDASVSSETDASAASNPTADAAGDVAEGRPTVVAMYGGPIRILERVTFKLHEAKLDKDDRALLLALAEALKAHPELPRIEVEGHSAAPEADKLAKKRAQLVLDELVKLGVEQKRLVLRDYGKTRPLDTRHSLNARVSFRVEETP